MASFSAPNLCHSPLYRQDVAFRPCRPLSLVLALPPPRFGLTAKLRCHVAQDPALLRRPLAPQEEESESEVEDEERLQTAEREQGSGRSKKNKWVDWEDLILEETVPLVSFVRMILHSGKYQSGDRLSPEHEQTIMEKLLPYHPEFEKKIGPGVDYLTIGNHPEFENSRCLFIVRKDGQSIDISYWKCIKGLIKKKYPLHADSFIVRHFRGRRYNRQ